MPVSSKTIMCNQALSIVGVNSRISDVDLENTPEARACRLWFEPIRDILLETLPWPFATRRWSLEDLGQDPLFPDYGYRYKKPADCILAVKLVNPYGRKVSLLVDPFGGPATILLTKPPFRIVDQADGYGDAILCDLDDAVLEGNYSVTDVNRFSNTFRQAMSMGIAAHIGPPLAVDAKIAAAAQGQFNGWLNEAVNLALREAREDPESPSEFQTIRS